MDAPLPRAPRGRAEATPPRDLWTEGHIRSIGWLFALLGVLFALPLLARLVGMRVRAHPLILVVAVPLALAGWMTRRYSAADRSVLVVLLSLLALSSVVSFFTPSPSWVDARRASVVAFRVVLLLFALPAVWTLVSERGRVVFRAAYRSRIAEHPFPPARAWTSPFFFGVVLVGVAVAFLAYSIARSAIGRSSP